MVLFPTERGCQFHPRTSSQHNDIESSDVTQGNWKNAGEIDWKHKQVSLYTKLFFNWFAIKGYTVKTLNNWSQFELEENEYVTNLIET